MNCTSHAFRSRSGRDIFRFRWSIAILGSTFGSTLLDDVREEPAPERAFFEHSRYLDLGPIARGAFGDVRRVRDARSSRVVAMKVMRRCIAQESRAYARFVTEIEIMTSLRHPGVLPVHDHGKFDDGRPWFTMPEVRGRTFSVVLDELHALDPHDVLRSSLFRYAIESLARCCQIVAFAHDQRIVHRDLKPQNMMVADDGETFVIDWGIAKQLTSSPHLASTNGNSQKQRARTATGEVLGTPSYMPPEQALGNISLQSPASDVYSLGALLYHLLTGQPPYRGTRPAVIAQIKRGPAPPISAIVGTNRALPQELVVLCETAMQRQVAMRISGARRMAQGLLEWLHRPSSADS